MPWGRPSMFIYYVRMVHSVWIDIRLRPRRYGRRLRQAPLLSLWGSQSLFQSLLRQ